MAAILRKLSSPKVATCLQSHFADVTNLSQNNRYDWTNYLSLRLLEISNNQRTNSGGLYLA